jgi:heterodisulfide reductase subunit C
MQSASQSGSVKTVPDFCEHVKEESGVDFNRCYQCLTCTLSCPVAPFMDYRPNEIIRMVQLGMRDEVLKSSTIWICASCQACMARCPNEINIPHLMDVLHQMALREGVDPKEPDIYKFQDCFLSPIKRYGRQYELLMTMQYTLRARKFGLKNIKDSASMGMKMMSKRKVKFFPPSSGEGAAKVKELFKETEARK